MTSTVGVSGVGEGGQAQIDECKRGVGGGL